MSNRGTKAKRDAEAKARKHREAQRRHKAKKGIGKQQMKEALARVHEYWRERQARAEAELGAVTSVEKATLR